MNIHWSNMGPEFVTYSGKNKNKNKNKRKTT